MKKSSTLSCSNFSMRCLKTMQRSVFELQKIIKALSFESEKHGILRHQSALIASSLRNLLTALTSCNTYRIPFSDESYYLTQFVKIERGINSAVDAITSLNCRGFFAQLGNNEAQEDIFAALEHTFDEFVGPLLHFLSNFNVNCLEFQCSPANLHLLDQHKAQTLLEERLTRRFQHSTNANQEDAQQIYNHIILSTSDAGTNAVTDEQSLSPSPAEAFSEILRSYFERSNEVKLPLSELAVLIDYMSNGNVSRYQATFNEFYSGMFEQLIEDKISLIVSRMESFNELNQAAKIAFYDTEIISLPSEEILSRIYQQEQYVLADLKLTLLRSGYESMVDDPLKGTPPPPPALQEGKEERFSMSSSVMKVGEVIRFCPHSQAVQYIRQTAESDEAACNCAYLKTQQNKGNKEEEEDEKMVVAQKDFFFGRRAANKIQTSTFRFADHERHISRQQFKITYDEFSNEYYAQCSSQANLTQLAVDQIGFELTEGSIFVVQDSIAFKVVASRGYSSTERLAAAAAAEGTVTSSEQSLIKDSQLKSQLVSKLSKSLQAAAVAGGDEGKTQRIISQVDVDNGDLLLDEENLSSSRSSSSSSSSSSNIAISEGKLLQPNTQSNQSVNTHSSTQGQSRKRIFYRQSSMLCKQNSLSQQTNGSSSEDSQEEVSESSSEDEEKKSSCLDALQDQVVAVDTAAAAAALIEKDKKRKMTTSSLSSSTSPLVMSNSYFSMSHSQIAANILEQPGIITRQPRSSSFRPAGGNANVGISPVGENRKGGGDAVVCGDDEEGEDTEDFKRSAGRAFTDCGASMNMHNASNISPPLPSGLNSSFSIQSMNCSGSINSMSKPLSTLQHSRSRSYFSQSMIDFDESRQRDEQQPFIQLQVMWSTLQTSREDYIFIYDNSTQTIKEKKAEVFPLLVNQLVVPAPANYIHIGSDSKSNLVHIEGENIKEFAHCSITFRENVWTILTLNEEGMKHYAGVALKTAEEADSALVSKKIVIDQGYNILAAGYIFNCGL